MLGLALILGIVLDRGHVYARGLFRLGFFIPYAVPNVVAALIWGYIYGPVFGPFSQLAKGLGLPPPDFLSDRTMLFSLANIVTWEFTGYNMVIYYAALKAIPSDLREAAAVDGASPWQLRAAYPTPPAVAGDPADHHLLDQRHPATVQRTLPNALNRAGRDRHALHAEHLCLFPVGCEPAIQLCRCGLFRPRIDHRRDRGRLHAGDPSQKGERGDDRRRPCPPALRRRDRSNGRSA